MDQSTPAEHRGKYRPSPIPIQFSQAHEGAGSEWCDSHVYLMPTFDIMTVSEDPADCQPEQPVQQAVRSEPLSERVQIQGQV